MKTKLYFHNGFLFFYGLMLWLLFGACTSPAAEGIEIHKNTSQPAADLILEVGTKDSVFLVLKNTWGTTVITPSQRKASKVYFSFPNFIKKTAGSLRYQLHTENKLLESGSLNIIPSLDQPIQLETYLGPKNLEAGSAQKSMLIAIPTDAYDNPLPNLTPVVVTYNFKEQIITDTLFTSSLLAFKTIVPPTQTGQINWVAACQETTSNELFSQIYAASPVDFEIAYNQTHAFADGNQVIEWYTSVLKDVYGNTVSDGTLVSFEIKNRLDEYTKIYASTLNGVARAKAIHPEEPQTWTVQAQVANLAKSNPVQVYFKSAVSEIPVIYNAAQRSLKVGPILGYMGQKVPEGTRVSIRLMNAAEVVFESMATTRNAMVNVKFPANLYPLKEYALELKTLGAIKTLKIKNYE